MAVEAEINAPKKAQPQTEAQAQVLAKECLDKSIVDFLTNAQKTLSSKDYQKLRTLTNDLTTTLSSKYRSSEEKSHAVDKYKRESKQIIGGRSLLIKGLTVVVIVALAGILAAGVGFGIGFAAGLWTGPGAFLTGLLNGSVAFSVMAMTSAAMTGALVGASYSAFFKPNPLKPILNAVVDNAAHCF